MQETQPELYKCVLNCNLLAAYAENKLERYRKSADTCEKILRITENYEALIVKAASLASLNMFLEAIVRYKRALAVAPGNKHCIEQIKFLRSKASNRIIDLPNLEIPQLVLDRQQNSQVSVSNMSGLSGVESTIGSTFGTDDKGSNDDISIKF